MKSLHIRKLLHYEYFSHAGKTLIYRDFSPHYGNLSQPLESEIFRVILYKIGKTQAL